MPFRETVRDLEATLPPATTRLARFSVLACRWHLPELCTYLLIVIFFTWAELAFTASLYCSDDLWITLLVSYSSKILMTYLSLHEAIWDFGKGATHRDSWRAIRKGYMGNDCITTYLADGLKFMIAFCFIWFAVSISLESVFLW